MTGEVTDLILLIPDENVADSVLKLKSIENLKVQIHTKENLPDSPQKDHPQRFLDLSELTPLIISISSIAASILTLAKAIIDLNKSRKSQKHIQIIVKHERISVEDNMDSDQLAEVIMKKIKDDAI